MKVSVIIPAYNVENYLSRAVNSVLEQNFQELEIVIVNDGSTDNTQKIANSLATEFCNVRVLNQQNQGVSEARNNGLKNAQGDYVCFLDADDYLEENVLSYFYSLCLDNNLDVIRGAYKIFSEEKNDYITHNAPNFSKINKVLNGKEFLNYSMQYHFNEVVPWLGLFKREYLINNSLVFPKGIAFEEDQLFFLKAMLLNGKFMQTNTYFLTYVYRSTSCTKNLNFKKAEDVAFIVKQEITLLKDIILDKQTYKNSLKYISSSFYQLTSIYGRVDKSLRKKCVKLVPFKTRVKLMFNPYNSYHFKKIFLFNFCRIVLNLYYDRNK